MEINYHASRFTYTTSVIKAHLRLEVILPLASGVVQRRPKYASTRENRQPPPPLAPRKEQLLDLFFIKESTLGFVRCHVQNQYFRCKKKTFYHPVVLM